MRPRRGGTPLQHNVRREITSSQLHNVITISDSSDSSLVMTGNRPVPRKGKGKGKSKGSAPSQSLVPDVYQEMLAEALPTQHHVPERPLKRRRKSQPNRRSSPGSSKQPIDLESHDTDNEEDIEFEDILSAEKLDGSDIESEAGDSELAPKRLQTAYKDSEDESEESDFEWEGVNLNAEAARDGPSGDLELTLAARTLPSQPSTVSRRKIVTKAERELRLQTHKLHLLCLLSYMDQRNNWCNDSAVQELLKPLVNKKMVTFLRPKSSLSQFGRAESLKRGLDDLSRMWRTKFRITERGMRRSLWAEGEQGLRQVQLPSVDISLDCKC
jgi:xeroderma pigmentosum group C-complementing protein